MLDRNWFCMSTGCSDSHVSHLLPGDAFAHVFHEKLVSGDSDGFGGVITSVLVCLTNSVAIGAANVLDYEHWAMIRAFRCVAHLSPLWIQMDTIRLMNMDAATMPAIQVIDDAVAHTVMVYFPLLPVV